MDVALRVDAVITDHFEVLVRDVDDQLFDEIGSGDGFRDESVVLMPVVVESDGMAVIMIDTGSGDNGPAQISADVFDDLFWVCKSRLGINVEAIRAMLIDIGFGFFEGFADVLLHMVQQGGAEGIAEQNVVEMLDCAPDGIVAGAAFGKKDVNVRVPLQASPKGVQNTNKSGSKILGLVHLEKHA